MNAPYTAKLGSAPSCPHCKKRLDGFAHLEGKATPSVGDITVCAYCSSVLEFTSGLKLKFAAMEGLENIDFPLLQQAHRVVAQINLKRKR